MKIAVNAGFLNARPTGVGVFTLEVVRELFAIEPDLVIFTPHPQSFPPGARCIRTPLRFQGSLSLAANLGRFLHCNMALSLQLHRLRVDALYCPILEYPFGLNIPTVVTVHDLHPLYFPAEFGAAAVHFRLALDWAVRRRLWIIVPSHHVRRELLGRWPESSSRIVPVSLGYDRRRFQPQPPAARDGFLKPYGIDGPYLLFVGSLFPYKNLQVLLDAFRLIRSRVPHQLVVLGKTEVAPRPPRPEPGVVYLDYVAQSELPRFYSYADLHVQPSRAEGFGLTVVEAMACGTPVLASEAGSLPEVVADAGLLFDPDDSRKLAQLLIRVLTDDELKRELSARGRARARRFDWARSARGVAAAIHCAVAARGTGETT